MATIEDLDQESITNMSTEQLMETLKEIRHSRRTSAKKVNAKKAKKEKEIEMTDKQMEELIRQLEEKLWCLI